MLILSKQVTYHGAMVELTKARWIATGAGPAYRQGRRKSEGHVSDPENEARHKEKHKAREIQALKVELTQLERVERVEAERKNILKPVANPLPEARRRLLQMASSGFGLGETDTNFDQA